MKENIKAPRHWSLCWEFTGIGEFPAQRASNAESVSIWWRHHVLQKSAMWDICLMHRRICEVGLSWQHCGQSHKTRDCSRWRRTVVTVFTSLVIRWQSRNTSAYVVSSDVWSSPKVVTSSFLPQRNRNKSAGSYCACTPEARVAASEYLNISCVYNFATISTKFTITSCVFTCDRASSIRHRSNYNIRYSQNC